MDYVNIEPLMRGQWGAFFESELGIEVPDNSRRKPHPCPVCGGDDRAHFREQDGRLFLFCRAACGTSSSPYGSNTCTPPEQLAMELAGIDFPELVERCAEFVGYVDDRPKRTVRKKEQEDKEPIHPALKALGQTKLMHWLKVTLCAENGVCVDAVHTLNDNVAVPLYMHVKGKPTMTCLAELTGETTVRFHGNKSGCYTTIGDVKCGGRGTLKGKKVFCTNWIIANQIHQAFNVQCVYAPDPRTMKKTDCDTAFVNSRDWEVIEKATAVYHQVNYAFPVGDFTRDRKLAVKSYDDVQAWIAQKEQELTEGR